MSQPVRAKKHLGQHFLIDEDAAGRIVGALDANGYRDVVEIGPGTGVLSKYLLKREDLRTILLDIDTESITFLRKHYPAHSEQIVEADYLQWNPATIFSGQFAVIGNFPYNISTQILFRVLEFRDRVPQVVGMFQEEVAVRIASRPGNRDYGILSVLMQAWYDVQLLLSLPQEAFQPPPKVRSAVIVCKRKDAEVPSCDEVLFKRVIKAAFNQRRKTLRNAMSSLVPKEQMAGLPYLELRAEALSWQQFEILTNAVAQLPGN